MGDPESIQCHRSRACSRPNHHFGLCNREKSFWEERHSTERLKRERKELSTLEEKSRRLDYDQSKLEERCQEVDEHRSQLVADKAKLEEHAQHVLAKEKEIVQKRDETELLLQSLLKILNQRGVSLKRKPTSQDMIGNSTWYRRRKETKDMLSFIHGDLDGAILGAWETICAFATPHKVDKFIVDYKKGKYLQGKFNTLTKKFESTDGSMNQAIALKYRGFLSRRKYDVQCRTLSSVFDPTQQVWLPRSVRVDGVDVQAIRQLSHYKLDMFVKSIDIGSLYHLPRELGVTRSVTALVHMVVDLHMRVPHLRKQLHWYNERENHFIFQFSDDGTREAADMPMSVGSLTCWNFHKRVSSRDLHYLLHLVSVEETDTVMADLWQQHTEEMALLEGSTFTISECPVTFEFVPSADQKWQCWANNETTNAATFPSPFADVSKHNMAVVGGSIGETWQPWTAESRLRDAEKVEGFLSTLPAGLAESTKKSKLNNFLAANRLRQLGMPRIGKYAALQRPESLHVEINATSHYLNLLYHEAVSRGNDCFYRFLSTLQAPVHCTELTRRDMVEVAPKGDNDRLGVGARARASASVASAAQAFMQSMQTLTDDLPQQDLQTLGLGLKSVAKDLQEQFNNEATRHNKCLTRLIGEHAVMLESYGYRLVDSLKIPGETAAQELRRLFLGKVGECLRDSASIFSQVQSDEGDLKTLELTCNRYYNLLCLFLPGSVTLSVWTLAKAIPYHARILWEKYHVGYGIISLQAKESKHSALKSDLGLTNRSKTRGMPNKWVQVFRSNFIRSFYLEEYSPSPPTYNPHFHCRVPKHAGHDGYCLCGRGKCSEDDELCSTCVKACTVVQCADDGNLSPRVTMLLKPHECSVCGERFADGCALTAHTAAHPSSSHADLSSSHADLSSPGTDLTPIDPRSLTVANMRKECKKHGLATSGKRAELIKRLEGVFSLNC
ncbi:uncharacterized protein [Branchiostoma lanceolatum]|uniref:uncharacterized protein n=1 Tax=Branchiostoma lanceolatum TaxID=7740 RepID=UPI003451569B